MQLIKPNVEIWGLNSPLFEDIDKHIERCGRVCYASSDKITDNSYRKFVDNIIKSGHLSVLEHGTFYLTIPIGSPISDMYYIKKTDLIKFFKENNYSFIVEKGPYNTVDETPEKFKDFAKHCGVTSIYYITTNYRVLIENNILDKIIPYIDKCTEHIPRITVHWTISRGIADEFARHRVFSFSMQSTRYCNYTKDRFSNELTFVLHSDMLDLPEGKYEYDVREGKSGYYCNDKFEIPFPIKETVECTDPRTPWIGLLQASEIAYQKEISAEWKPQQARGVLPLDIRTELVQTGTLPQWEEFFKLRCAKGAHPDAQYIANKLKDIIYDRKS